MDASTWLSEKENLVTRELLFRYRLCYDLALATARRNNHLGIISRSANRDTLPFFSRVTLRRTSQELRRLGYDVRLAFIADKSQKTSQDPSTASRRGKGAR
jgi:hypothetical protein